MSLSQILPPDEFLNAPEPQTADVLAEGAPTPVLHVERDNDASVLHVEQEINNIHPLRSPHAPSPPRSAGQAPTAMLHVEHGAPATLKNIPLDTIRAGSAQPRAHFDEDDLNDLAASIRTVGVIQPIIVKPCTGGHAWEIVAGERRWRAATLVGLDTIPAIIRDMDEDDALTVALLENIQRADLNPIEEALAYQKVLQRTQMRQEDLGEFLGKSRAAIGHSISLLKLPDTVQTRIAAGVITRGHAKCLITAPTPEIAERLTDRIIRESLTVRALEEIMILADYGVSEADVTPKPPRRKKSGSGADYQPVADDLGNWLETRTHVRSHGSGRGTITIHFADTDDLWRILGILGHNPNQNL